MAAKIILFLFLVFYNFKSMANELIKVLDQESNYVELKIIDKITSRLTVRKLKIKTLNNVKDFEIFVDKCILDKRKGFLETSAFGYSSPSLCPSSYTVFI